MPIYTCAELKGRIKVGHKVKQVEGGYGSCYTLENGKTGTITKVNEAGFWIDDCAHAYSELFSLELLDEEKTLDMVDVGDVVFNAMGKAYVILDTSKNGTILFLARAESGMLDFTATRSYLEKACFTVKQPKPVRKMTLAEVEKLVGERIEIVEE